MSKPMIGTDGENTDRAKRGNGRLKAMLRANWPYLLLALVVFVLTRAVIELWPAPQSPEESFLAEANSRIRFCRAPKIGRLFRA